MQAVTHFTLSLAVRIRINTVSTFLLSFYASTAYFNREARFVYVFTQAQLTLQLIKSPRSPNVHMIQYRITVDNQCLDMCSISIILNIVLSRTFVYGACAQRYVCMSQDESKHDVIASRESALQISNNPSLIL